jgi:uroporphyrinogen-III synthase
VSLRGKVVAITRPRRHAQESAELVSRRGGIPYLAPTLEIKPAKSLEPIMKLVELMVSGSLDYLIFVSRNAVLGFFEALSRLGCRNEAVRALGRTEVVAIGARTRKELEDHGVEAVLTPRDYSSEGIVRLLRRSGLRGKNAVVLRAGNQSGYLRRELGRLFAGILEVPVYESALPSDRSGVLRLIEDLLNGRIDVITFTSPATARNLFGVAGERSLSRELGACLREKVVVAAIGPVTKEALEELGVRVHVVPKKYTVEAMVAALEGYLKKLGGGRAQPTSS